MKLYTAHQAQTLDKLAIEQFGIPGILLMKTAAYAALEQIKTAYPDCHRLHIVCGIGNNGGDGYMLGQLATLAGYEVQMFQVGPTHKIKGDALTALHELVDCGLHPYPLTDKALADAELIVDAIFGIGLQRPVEGQFAEAIERINRHPAPVFALDTPSGIDATTGTKLGVAIQADHTLSFIAPKIGLYQSDGKTHAGQVTVHDLHLNTQQPELFEKIQPIAQTLDAITAPLLNRWKHRPANSHKGSFGTACLIGGNHGMMGAIQLAAQACLHSGAGLTQVLTQAEHTTPITQATPEIMCYPATEHLTSALSTATAVGIGPGLGQDEWGKQQFKHFLTHRKVEQPAVIDADALNLLAERNLQNQAPQFLENTLFTPHPGEAARLLQTSTQAVQSNRLEAIQQLQAQFGGIWILKGAGTLIFDGETTWLCQAGNAGMAVGGMGDVLTGILTSLLAQGFSPLAAAQLGVTLHAQAADTATQIQNLPSLTPTDLIHTLKKL